MRGVRTWGALAAIGVACVVLPVAASGAPAANSTTYTDSSGEDPTGPDITTLVTSNNDAGTITFRVNIPNRPALGTDMLVGLEVDTDNNPATGSPDGTDYAIELFRGDIALFRWDGENFTRRPGDPPFTSLLFSYQGGVTITISAAELGNTTRFRFNAIAISGIVVDQTTGGLDFTSARADVAPAIDAGLYSYEVRIARPTIVVARFRTTPAAPAAGRAFSARMRATRSDTGAPIRGGRITCAGRLGNAAVRGTGSFVGGEVVCTWRIPANAKGKRFRGTVTVVFEGLRASRTFSGRVR